MRIVLENKDFLKLLRVVFWTGFYSPGNGYSFSNNILPTNTTIF